MELRRSWYWDDFTDDDLEYLIRSHKALMLHSTDEIANIERELQKRQTWDEENDASISRQ